MDENDKKILGIFTSTKGMPIWSAILIWIAQIIALIIGAICFGLLLYSFINGVFINPPKEKPWGDCDTGDCSGLNEYPN